MRNNFSSIIYTNTRNYMYEMPLVEAITPVCYYPCTPAVVLTMVAVTNPASATTSSRPGGPASFEMLVCSSTPAFSSMITNTNSTMIAPPYTMLCTAATNSAPSNQNKTASGTITT